MLKKVFLFLLILLIIYFILIFKAPSLADGIEKLHGIKGFNNYIILLKNRFDEMVTDIPTKGEVINTYDKAYSGAINIKDEIIDGINTTKTKIDDTREKVGQIQNKYNEVKGTYEDIKDKVGDVKGQINEIKGTIDTFSGITNNISNAIETITSTGTIN